MGADAYTGHGNGQKNVQRSEIGRTQSGQSRAQSDARQPQRAKEHKALTAYRRRFSKPARARPSAPGRRPPSTIFRQMFAEPAARCRSGGAKAGGGQKSARADPRPPSARPPARRNSAVAPQASRGFSDPANQVVPVAKVLSARRPGLNGGRPRVRCFPAERGALDEVPPGFNGMIARDGREPHSWGGGAGPTSCAGPGTCARWSCAARSAALSGRKKARAASSTSSRVAM